MMYCTVLLLGDREGKNTKNVTQLPTSCCKRKHEEVEANLLRDHFKLKIEESLFF